MASDIWFYEVPHEKGGVQKTVDKAMNAIDWRRQISGKKIFVKVNLCSSEFVPGQCTSPLVLDGVLKVLSENDFDITVGDADLAAARQCEKAAKVWGHTKILDEYGVKFQNLSKDEMTSLPINGKVFEMLDIPKTVLESDHIIDLPVPKTHCLTTITCSLKNFWGVVPRVRHQYHLVVDEAIADINSFLMSRPLSVIVDGTIGMEENGPRTGKSRIADCVFSSIDPVAIDSFAAWIMGFQTPEHVKKAAERKLGSLEYNVKGDVPKRLNFEPPKPDSQPIFRWEIFFRRSFIKPLLFDTSIFSLLSYIATKYNTFYYYNRWGKSHQKNVMNSWYGEELRKFVD